MESRLDVGLESPDQVQNCVGFLLEFPDLVESRFALGLKRPEKV